MNTPQRTPGKGWLGRLAGLLFCALFALSFGGVGLGAVAALTVMLHGAWQASDWPQVPAEVLENSLSTKSDGDGGTVFRVQARYRYEWQGRAYESTAIGLPGSFGSDDIDGWHQFWDARLRAASNDGPPIHARVNPQHPEQALLDPQVRWRQVIFLLPFAIIFTMVGVGAAYAGWSVMTRPRPGEAPVPQQHAPQHRLVGAWCFTIAVCAMALPAVSAASSRSTPWWVSFVAALFALGALALLALAVVATWRAWTYHGTVARFKPAQPLAGAAFQVHWALPARAAAPWLQQAAVALRVAQYRLDEVSSGSKERQVQTFIQQVQPQAQPDGGMSLQARFELPADAPADGVRRAGEKVSWRLEWLDAQGKVVLTVPVPVESTALTDADSIALRPGARREPRDIPVEPVHDAMPAAPRSVQLQERPDALVLRFRQRGWRWAGVISLLALAAAFTRSSVVLEAALLALALHGLSRRWTLALRDDGLLQDRSSWLWHRRLTLQAASLQNLYQDWAYSTGAGASEKAYYALWARHPERGNARLTPGLADGGAVQIARLLRWAQAHRAGRFSPGGQRTLAGSWSSPGWGWALCLLWVVARLWMPG